MKVRRLGSCERSLYSMRSVILSQCCYLFHMSVTRRQTPTLQYIGNGSTYRHNIWHDDAYYGVMNK